MNDGILKERYFDWAATALADEDILRDALEKVGDHRYEFSSIPLSA